MQKNLFQSYFINYLMPTFIFNNIFSAINGMFVIQVVIYLFAFGFGGFNLL